MTNLNTPTTYRGFSFQEWRENFIRIVLIGASAVGTVALIVNFLGHKNPVYLAVYAALFVVLLVVTFIRLPYQLKAGIFLTLVGALAVSSLIETGIWGGSRMYLLTLVVMSGLLFSPRASINAIAISLVVIIAIGWLVLTGQFQPTDPNVSAGTLGLWAINTSGLLMTQVIVTTGLYLFEKQFDKAQEQASRVVDTLGTERVSLEERVAEHTKELEERNAQMRAMVYFAREIASYQDVPILLNQAANLITQRFGHYHVAIFLLDEEAKAAFLQAASSDAGKKLLEDGYRVEIGGRNVIGRVAEEGKFHLQVNFSPDSINDPVLPRTRSELTLPLLVREKVIGVLDIQSELPQAFGQNEAEIFQLLADQIAASITNARLLSESQAFIGQLEAVTTQQTHNAWQEHLKEKGLAYQFTPAGVKSIPSGTRPKDKKELSIPLVLRG
ncbi:MAG TPA: GAF domain-containing protein, partial [Anaerolineales bacterium]|nr:GAF domain-containing protein [Anaerolineales bacterium]